MCTGTNAIAEQYNLQELNSLTSELNTFKAKVFYSTGKAVKNPVVEPNGLIRNTPLPLNCSIIKYEDMYVLYHCERTNTISEG